MSPPSNIANPNVADLAPRRWLAQLAVNIVDYIDDDEISTPFNFYDSSNNGNPAPPSGNNAAGNPTPYQVDGANNTQASPTLSTIPVWPNPNAAFPMANTGNPDVPAYWVFGTELPYVVINEVQGEYTLPTNNMTPPLAAAGTFNVNLWVELFNPLPAPAHGDGNGRSERKYATAAGRYAGAPVHASRRRRRAPTVRISWSLPTMAKSSLPTLYPF